MLIVCHEETGMLKYPLHFQPCLDLGETLAQVGETYLYKSIV